MRGTASSKPPTAAVTPSSDSENVAADHRRAVNTVSLRTGRIVLSSGTSWRSSSSSLRVNSSITPTFVSGAWMVNGSARHSASSSVGGALAEDERAQHVAHRHRRRVLHVAAPAVVLGAVEPSVTERHQRSPLRSLTMRPRSFQAS